jgi:hypothetical protein
MPAQHRLHKRWRDDTKARKSGRGEERRVLRPVHHMQIAMQCRSAEVTKLATAVGVGHRQPRSPYSIPSFSCAHTTLRYGLAVAVAVAVAAKAVGVSLASSPNRTKLGSIFPRGRGQARSAPCQHYTPRACQCHPASLARSFSFVAGWSTSMGSARWGETVEESFGPVWRGGPMRSNCTGLRSTLN